MYGRELSWATVLDRDDISDDIHLFVEKLREWGDYYNTIARTERWTVRLLMKNCSSNWRAPDCM